MADKIYINGKCYISHPVYNLYAGSKGGFIINLIKQNPMKGNIANTGYLRVSVRKHGDSNKKTCFTHRFIWECYNGLIQDDKVIDHINNIKDDNRLSNLQLISQR